MDSEKQNSFKKSNSLMVRYCCLFFIFLIFILLSSSILLILLILKPKKPIFHLNSVHLDHIKLEDSSLGKGLILQASTASLLFVTQNSNKFGIRYSATNLMMICGSHPVGIVKVPGFYQPPNGSNVTVIMHVLLERVNISRFMNAKIEHNFENPSNGALIEVQIIGIVRARIHVFNLSFPTTKVCVDCRVKLDYGAETFSRGLMFMKNHEDLVLSKFSHFSQKCSAALCL